MLSRAEHVSRSLRCQWVTPCQHHQYQPNYRENCSTPSTSHNSQLHFSWISLDLVWFRLVEMFKGQLQSGHEIGFINDLFNIKSQINRLQIFKTLIFKIFGQIYLFILLVTCWRTVICFSFLINSNENASNNEFSESLVWKSIIENWQTYIFIKFYLCCCCCFVISVIFVFKHVQTSSAEATTLLNWKLRVENIIRTSINEKVCNLSLRCQEFERLKKG